MNGRSPGRDGTTLRELDRPYAYLAEDERSAAGHVQPVATIFLTNRRCPFPCIFCDLWRNTTDQPVPPGSIPAQIDIALAALPVCRQLKLYNSGNFFDRKAIPRADHGAIAARARPFETLIVENHPRLCGVDCREFQRRLDPPCEFEIAMGLETVHPQVLPKLNKQMSLDDFARAAERLHDWGIHTRAFVLVKPPFIRSEDEAVEWAIRSVEWAFKLGVRCCSLIPTRGGVDTIDQLQARGLFSPPRIDTLERVVAQLLPRQQGRVFVDLWDLRRFSGCGNCLDRRTERLRRVNHLQTLPPSIHCDCHVEDSA
jgi:radical SAM enzyme (TIGR01210 family)